LNLRLLAEILDTRSKPENAMVKAEAKGIDGLRIRRGWYSQTKTTSRYSPFFFIAIPRFALQLYRFARVFSDTSTQMRPHVPTDTVRLSLLVSKASGLHGFAETLHTVLTRSFRMSQVTGHLFFENFLGVTGVCGELRIFETCHKFGGK
jgi:hypothetical protein